MRSSPMRHFFVKELSTVATIYTANTRLATGPYDHACPSMSCFACAQESVQRVSPIATKQVRYQAKVCIRRGILGANRPPVRFRSVETRIDKLASRLVLASEESLPLRTG